MSAGDERRPARERLEGLVRDHAAGLRGGAEHAERAAGPLVLLRQLLVVDPVDPLDVRRPLVEERVELAAADDAKRDLGREARRRQDRLEPVQRDQLADEERVEVLRRLPARPEEPLLGADEADRQPLLGQPAELGEVACVLLRVGDDEVGAPERDPVDPAEDAGGGRARPEAAAVLDEGLVERDERVEDDGTAACDPPGRGQVEVARVADDDGVEALAPAAEQQPRLGQADPRGRPEADRPVVPPPLPHARVPLDHLRAGAAEAGDHLRVARVVALVRPEVEDPQVSAGSRPRAAGCSARRRAPRGGSRRAR